MRAAVLLLVALCLVPEQILSGKVSKYGLSSWCLRKKVEGLYPLAPATCCQVFYGCDVFIKPGKTKWGITNTGTWNLRRCACDILFYDCLLNKQERVDAFKTTFLTLRHSCLAPKKCDPGKDCKDQYEVVNYGQLVSEMNAGSQEPGVEVCEND